MVSATVPNIADVAQWVGSVHEARNPAKTFEVHSQVYACLSIADAQLNIVRRAVSTLPAFPLRSRVSEKRNESVRLRQCS